MSHEHSSMIKSDNEFNLIKNSNKKLIENSNNFQSSMVAKMIKYEPLNNSSVIKLQSNNTQVPTNSNSSGNRSTNNSNSSLSASGSTKMGSRRIFTPQFKLQVLDSYRNDLDCKGNQRATARKYGIHRRQIQKWLQGETNLRSSVANLNQNNVKHQFHNISHQMPIVSSTSSISHSNNQQYKANNNVLSLDTARHSVALTSLAMSSSATGVPSVVAEVSPPTRPIPKPLNCSNSTLMKNPLIQSTEVPILRTPTPYKISTSDSVMLTHTPASIASVPVQPVPILPHAHNSHYHHQQHHNHHQQLHHAQIEQQSRPHFMPSASLPVLSASSRNNSPSTIISPISPTSAIKTDGILCDYQFNSIASQTTGNRFMNTNNADRSQKLYETGFRYYGNNSHQIELFGVAPIDLSLGPRRLEISPEETRPNPIENNNYSTKNNNSSNNANLKATEDDESISLAVDLSCRKRKNGQEDNGSTPEKLQKVEEIPEANGEQQQVKPVKLFKPYLLDSEDEKPLNCDNEQRDPIIWSHHPTCRTPGSQDGRQSSCSGGSNFQLSNGDAYPFPSGSPIFQGSTTTTVPIVSPSITPTAFSCPKGSPVSGYESSSSVYSDSAGSEYYYSRVQEPISGSHQARTYSLDFKVQPIDNGYYYDQVAPKNHVQRWLDQDISIRQGIILYG